MVDAFTSCSSYTWGGVPRAFGWPRASPLPPQLLPEVPSPPQETPVSFGPYRGTSVSHQGNMQRPHLHISYCGGVAAAKNVAIHGPITATDPKFLIYSQATVGNFEYVFGAVDDVMNPANAGLGRRLDHGPHLGNNITPYLGVIDIPANYGMNINVLYTRRTRTGRRAPVSAPPQAFEGDPDVLAVRLIDEGADPEVVNIMRRWIFVLKVTEQALEAPIESRELSSRHGGIKVKWRLLLQVTEGTTGEQSYCCRLCPLERRPEYKNAPDVLRHLKRDHFGFSVACQYW